MMAADIGAGAGARMSATATKNLAVVVIVVVVIVVVVVFGVVAQVVVVGAVVVAFLVREHRLTTTAAASRGNGGQSTTMPSLCRARPTRRWHLWQCQFSKDPVDSRRRTPQSPLGLA